ncbi:MAG: hypothetical protein OEY88_01545 [Candidatus Bathyarchaeota archaeon]|nr:hypothetical protein [Candidatus Bathyarchaeota archaeon]
MSLNEIDSKSSGNSNDFSRIYREILMSVLKLTSMGPVSKALVSREAKVASQVATETLRRFSDEGIIYLTEKTVETSSSQRINITLKALKLGADVQKVCSSLRWQEFENIAATAFEANNFWVKRRVRFTWANRRWEIDVLGCKKPIIVCVDCKHWHHGWGTSAIAKAAEGQIQRTKALTETLHFTSVMLKRLGLANWKQGILIPLILSLVPSPFKFYRKTPIVPILQLQNFLSELPAYTDRLKRFRWENI